MGLIITSQNPYHKWDVNSNWIKWWVINKELKVHIVTKHVFGGRKQHIQVPVYTTGISKKTELMLISKLLLIRFMLDIYSLSFLHNIWAKNVCKKCSKLILKRLYILSFYPVLAAEIDVKCIIILGRLNEISIIYVSKDNSSWFRSYSWLIK